MTEFTPSPLSDEEARRQRQEALTALARSHLGAPVTASPSNPSGEPAPERRGTSPAHSTRRQPLWLILGCLALAAVLVAGIVLHQLGILPGGTASSHSGSTSVVFVPSLQGQDCLMDAAWSPDNKQVAVLGYSETCPSDFPDDYNYQAGMLNIYSAATGRVVQAILPDPTILALPGIPAPPADVQPAAATSVTTKPVINYGQVLWSPDGKRLALTFFVGHFIHVNTFPTYVVAVQGLVLMNADGTGEHVALFTVTNQQGGALIWNVATLKSVAVSVPARYNGLLSVPPAMSYTWSANGQLTPQGSLDGPLASPTLPAGNPDGGSSFTIWQPGYISLSTQGNVDGSPVSVEPGVYSWGTGFAAWSPNGTYLVDAISLNGVVQPPGEPASTAAGLQALGLTGAPSVVIHDPAEQRLLQSLHPNTTGAESIPAQDNVAWSPNGRVLAALPDNFAPNSTGGNQTSSPVTFYDCATGTILSTLQPESSSRITANDVAGGSNGGLLRWSVDGSHFLVYSGQVDTITIWSTSKLPRTA